MAKYINIKEFCEQGYLQEVNRQFFHPLGLALTVSVDEYGNETISGVQDFREDPEGMIFAEGVLSKEKGARVAAAQAEREEPRQKALGYLIQPL